MKQDIGKIFGNLEVLSEKKELVGKHNRTFYYCRCLICNNHKWIRADVIKGGKQQSCGCLQKTTQFKARNLEGMKIGRLTVMNSTEKRDKDGHVVWVCKCDCGNIVEYDTDLLLHKTVYSCGCLRKELGKEKGKKIGKMNIENNVVFDTHLKNIANNKPLKNNTTGYRGVTYDKKRGKYVAQIEFQKKHYFLGRYKTAEEAAEAYRIAKNKLHGDFLEWYKNNFKYKEIERVIDGEKIT